MLVDVPEPFDFELSTERFRTLGPDLANLWEEGALHRVFAGRGVRIEAAPGGVRIDADGSEVAAAVRRFLGAAFDLDGFARFAEERDAVLARPVAALQGLRPPLVPDPFEALVTSISAQQVSLRAALAIRNRLVRRFSRRVGRAFPFPSRERLAEARAEDLVEVGFSRAKARSILGLARGELDLDGLVTLPDDEVRASLCAQPGIGPWTADWFLARHLGRPDAWPAGDLGLRKAVSLFYLGGRAASEADMREVGSRLSPFRNLAAHYLLAALRRGLGTPS